MRPCLKMSVASAVPVLLFGLSAGGCTASQTTTLAALAEYDPAPDLGRPRWIRAAAGFAAWIGGGIGGVASLVLLPVTYPTSLLMDEPLGYAKGEFIYLPVGICASGLHYAVGAPLDTLDFLLRRVWLPEDKTPGYDFTPMPAPKLRDPATGPARTEPPAQKEPEGKAEGGDPRSATPKQKDDDR